MLVLRYCVSSKRIFVLGPSHRYYTQGCELTQASIYRTPLGDMKIDTDVIKELHSTGAFEKMSPSVDAEEHSIELQLPFIAHMMKGREFTLVPILVG